MTLEQRNILAHVVIDPDTWLAHVIAEFGLNRAQKAFEAKIVRWKPVYELAKLNEGVNYKTRAVRQAEADLAEEAAFQARLQAKQAQKQAEQEALRALIIEEIAKSKG